MQCLQIRESDNHADFIQRANQAELSTEDKIALLSYLGGRAGDNYDDSNTFEKVSLDRIFGGIQTLVETGEITPSGAMCGGIHDFIRESAQGLGLQAATYSGRMGAEGNGHIFASVLGEDGFVNIDYDELVRTGTFNFYRALDLAQQVEGSTVFAHHVYDDKFLFRRITPDGQRFFRFIQVDPSLDSFIGRVENGLQFSPGAHITLGNTEVSAGYELKPYEQVPISFTFKAGTMFGQPNGALDRAEMFEALGRWDFQISDAPCDIDFDFRAGLVYGLFHQAKTQKSLIALADGQLSLAVELPEDQKVKLYIRTVFAVDMLGIEDSEGSTGVVHLFDLNAMLAYESGVLNPYAAIQLMGGSNNVQEQSSALHVGDVEAGLIWKTPLANIRTAGRLAPEALVARLGVETDRFGLDLRYGHGRQGVFTPDFIEADAHGRIILQDIMPAHPLANRTSLEGKVGVRHERWSNGEENNQGTAQLTLQIEF